MSSHMKGGHEFGSPFSHNYLSKPIIMMIQPASNNQVRSGLRNYQANRIRVEVFDPISIGLGLIQPYMGRREACPT